MTTEAGWFYSKLILYSFTCRCRYYDRKYPAIGEECNNIKVKMKKRKKNQGMQKRENMKSYFQFTENYFCGRFPVLTSRSSQSGGRRGRSLLMSDTPAERDWGTLILYCMSKQLVPRTAPRFTSYFTFMKWLIQMFAIICLYNRFKKYCEIILIGGGQCSWNIK